MANLIEPSSFDLVLLDTGLPQCIVSAAASSSGRSVLHVDPCDFYGSLWTSLPLSDLVSWSAAEGSLPFSSSASDRTPAQTNVADILTPEDRARREVADELQSNEERLQISPSDEKKLEKLTDGSSSDQGKPEIVPDFLQSKGGELEKCADILSAHEEKHEKLTTVLSSDEENIQKDEEVTNNLPSGSGNSPNMNPNSLVMQEKNLEAIPLHPLTMYSNFRVIQANLEENLGFLRGYNIDIAGPKLSFCNGPLVDLVIRSGTHNYLQFRGLEASFIWTPEGLSPVPSSRADVFKDRTLSAVEKRYLMRFFKMVIDQTSTPNLEASQLCEEDLNLPFVEFLQKQKLPSSVQAIILYAIALANDKQDLGMEERGPVISTREGMQNLALYLSSVGRYENAVGAFLYPLYGQGELPQAFSRLAAVKGALYVLRMPVDAFLRNKETHEFEGLLMSTGQLIFSKKLVAGPSSYATLCRTLSDLNSDDNVDVSENKKGSHKIVRSICITDKSLQPGISTLLVVCPPQSIRNEATSVIRALQLGADANVCPEGKFIVQLSMACSDESIGIEAIHSATKVLFNCTENKERVLTDSKPTLLWALIFVQHRTFPESFKWVSEGHIAVFGAPDETLDYRNVVSSAEKIFQGLYPTDIFFAPTVPTEVDGEEDLEDQSSDMIDRETLIDDGAECRSTNLTDHSVDDMTGSSERDEGKLNTELLDASN